MIFRYMNKSINTTDLPSQQGVLVFLKEKGANDAIGLTELREMQYDKFGIELIWRYPLSDGKHLGFFIIPVQEGFLCLPYDAVDEAMGEILMTDEAQLLDKDAAEYFIEDWKSYTDGLIDALNDMTTVLNSSTKEIKEQ